VAVGGGPFNVGRLDTARSPDAPTAQDLQDFQVLGGIVRYGLAVRRVILARADERCQGAELGA